MNRAVPPDLSFDRFGVTRNADNLHAAVIPFGVTTRPYHERKTDQREAKASLKLGNHGSVVSALALLVNAKFINVKGIAHSSRARKNR